MKLARCLRRESFPPPRRADVTSCAAGVSRDAAIKAKHVLWREYRMPGRVEAGDHHARVVLFNSLVAGRRRRGRRNAGAARGARRQRVRVGVRQATRRQRPLHHMRRHRGNSPASTTTTLTSPWRCALWPAERLSQHPRFIFMFLKLPLFEARRMHRRPCLPPGSLQAWLAYSARGDGVAEWAVAKLQAIEIGMMAEVLRATRACGRGAPSYSSGTPRPPLHLADGEALKNKTNLLPCQLNSVFLLCWVCACPCCAPPSSGVRRWPRSALGAARSANASRSR